MLERIPGPDIPAEVAPVATSRRRLWAAALTAGVLASGLSWTAGEASLDRFKSTKVIDPLRDQVDPTEVSRFAVKNATLACGLQGALLGLTLGLAGAAAGRRPGRDAATAGLAGLALGGVLGAAASFGLFTAFFATVDPNSQDLIPSLLTHAGVASLLGASGGVAFGLGLGSRGRIVRAAVGGLIGAALGAGLYEILGGILFPLGKTGDPVAESGPARFLFHSMVDLLAAIGAAALADSRETR